MKNDKEFCIAPFTNIFIAGSGDLYLCCAYEQRYANLYDSSVDDILYGEKICDLRRQSAELELSCRKCNYAHKTHNPKNLGAQELLEPFQDVNIAKIQMEIGYFCPSRCSFCEQPHHVKSHLPYDKLKELILRTKPAEIQLQGGESYYVPGAKEFFAWIIENKADTKILMHTNCVIPEKDAKFMLDLVDGLSLNLYGVSSETFYFTTGMHFAKAQAFVNRMIAENRQRDGKVELLPKLLVTPTTLGEIAKFLSFSNDLGVEFFRIYFDCVYDFSKTPHEGIQCLFTSINRCLNDMGKLSPTTEKDLEISLQRIGFVRQYDHPEQVRAEALLEKLIDSSELNEPNHELDVDLLCVTENCLNMRLDMQISEYWHAMDLLFNRIEKMQLEGFNLRFSVFDFNLHEIPLAIEYAQNVNAKSISFIWSDSAEYFMSRYDNECKLRLYTLIEKATEELDYPIYGLEVLQNNILLIRKRDDKTEYSIDVSQMKNFMKRKELSREEAFASKNL